MPVRHSRALARLWSLVVPLERRQEALVAPVPRAPRQSIPAAPTEDVSTRHFRRLADVVERGRVQMGSIAVSQEAAATRIEAAEHAYFRLRQELSELLNVLPADLRKDRRAV